MKGLIMKNSFLIFCAFAICAMLGILIFCETTEAATNDIFGSATWKNDSYIISGEFKHSSTLSGNNIAFETGYSRGFEDGDNFWSMLDLEFLAVSQLRPVARLDFNLAADYLRAGAGLVYDLPQLVYYTNFTGLLYARHSISLIGVLDHSRQDIFTNLRYKATGEGLGLSASAMADIMPGLYSYRVDLDAPLAKTASATLSGRWLHSDDKTLDSSISAGYRYSF